MLLSLISNIPLVTTVLAVILSIVYYVVKNNSLPPGPYGLPYFGYWPFLKNESLHLRLHDMQRKHGEVFSFNVVGHSIINLGSIKAMKEIYITKADCFIRAPQFSLLYLTFGEGVSFANGETWKVFRKVFVQLFREYGLASIKNTTAGPIYDSVNEVVTELRARKGEPVNILEILNDKCMVIMRKTLFGEGGMTEEQSREFNQAYTDFLEITTARNLLLYGSFARHIILPLLPSFRQSLKNHERMRRILCAIIREHEATFSEDHNRDMIDNYIKERNVRREKDDPTAKYYTEEMLASTLQQILGDGTVTVADFIDAFIKGVAQHPEEQEKMYEEVVDVLGPDRQPSVEDKGNLPYTNAFLYELLRTSDVFTTFSSYVCIKETSLNGYRIPEGAIPMTNIWAANHDPEVYEEPYKFNPSRFMSTVGKQRPDLPITFGIGKRSCMGENFVMVQIFLFVASLVKNFHLKMYAADSPLDIKNSGGKWKLCAHPRNEK